MEDIVDFAKLKKNIKKDFSGFSKIKIAILGDSATQFLNQALRGQGYNEKLDLEIWEADFNQIDRQVLDPSSDLYNFKPDVIVIFKSSHKLLAKYNKSNGENRSEFSNNELENISDLLSNINSRLNSKIILFNFNEIDDSVLGGFANQVESSFLYQLRKLNYELMLLSSQESNLFLCDLSSIQNLLGKSNFFQPSIYINTEMVISIDALPHIAKRTIQVISSLNGRQKKCLILDLDNTMWGGVIGDDGIENIQIGGLGIGKAFTEFQYWIKKLNQRGIILAVCSKNTESIAKTPFESHPEMVIRLEDIAVFVANWENKADNIRSIQNVLNIGFDSMVFLDDNPFERNMVRTNLPEVCVPELPEDPADYLEYIYNLNLFDTSNYSSEDNKRTKQYQTEAKRVAVKNQFANEDEFLSSLDMVSHMEPFNSFNTPRVSQLSQRSNQFNLRTIRYSEADIKSISEGTTHESYTFTLNDKFGENGLICVIILEKVSENNLFIDTWFMSCRVLKRGMENFVLNHIVNYAKKHNFKNVIGEYIQTPKNEIVKNHYNDLGFEKNGNKWLLDINSYQNKKTFIKLNNNG